MRRWADFVIRHSRLILFFGLLLSLLCTIPAVSLYRNLRLDFNELLPTDARSVRDLDQVKDRLRAIDNLSVVIFSKNPDASRRFVDDLARKLSQAPKTVIDSVEYKIDEEIDFFKKRKALYLGTGELEKIRDYIEDRIEYETEVRNPLNIFSEKSFPEPKLDLDAIQRQSEASFSSYGRFPKGYYASPDEKIRVILVYKSGSSEHIQLLRQLKSYVEAGARELKPATYSPDLAIHFSGNVENMLEEQAAILGDLELSGVLVTFFVCLVLYLYYRSLVISFALITTVLMGTLWTLGITYLWIGFLNANSAFLGSIIIGNGINFGIILAARYLEERRNGLLSRQGALETALVRSASATWTAALAAGLAYGSLMLTGFRGFRQFGQIGLIGMILCWIASFTVLPAMLLALDREKKPKAALQLVPRRAAIIAPGARLSFCRWTLGISVALTLAAWSLAPRITPDLLEADLTKIRSRQSLKQGSGFYASYVDQVFQRYLSPVVAMPRSRADALRIAETIRTRVRKEGKNSLVANVQTVDDFVPKDQARKIAILKEIQALLPPKVLRHFSAADRGRVRDFVTPEALQPIRLNNLPKLVLNKFTERDGSIGKLVLVEPPVGDRIAHRANLFQFVSLLRADVDTVKPGTPVAGTLLVTADMFQSISHDGPKATIIAFSLVVMLVLLLFRNMRKALDVLLSLLFGLSWLIGLILAFRLKINFLNFVALPITFGIGVDYGVNVIQRYQQEGRGGIGRAVRTTGTAVALCSSTTIIGYCSLLLARNLAFVSFGLLAVLGEITCIIAALVTVPSMIALRDQKELARKPSVQRTEEKRAA